MLIRSATGADAPAISALNVEVQAVHAEALPHIFKPPSKGAFPPAEVASWFDDPRNHVYLACEEEESVGYIWARVLSLSETSYRYGLDVIYINHLVVGSARRRQGVGRALIEKVLCLARERGISMVQLDVWSFNEQARAFFRRQGFAPFNERMWLSIGHPDTAA